MKNFLKTMIIFLSIVVSSSFADCQYGYYVNVVSRDGISTSADLSVQEIQTTPSQVMLKNWDIGSFNMNTFGDSLLFSGDSAIVQLTFVQSGKPNIIYSTQIDMGYCNQEKAQTFQFPADFTKNTGSTS